MNPPTNDIFEPPQTVCQACDIDFLTNVDWYRHTLNCPVAEFPGTLLTNAIHAFVNAKRSLKHAQDNLEELERTYLPTHSDVRIAVEMLSSLRRWLIPSLEDDIRCMVWEYTHKLDRLCATDSTTPL